MLTRLLMAVFVAMMTFAPASWAADFKVATIDYNRAIQEIEEGKQAQARLDKMLEGKRAEIEQLEADLRSLQQEYQSKAAVLSETARQDYERRLYEMNARYQQLYQSSEMARQEAYLSAMEGLMTGLKVTAEQVGKEKNLDLILEVSQGTVLYAKPGTDITDEVVKRYNAAHPVKK